MMSQLKQSLIQKPMSEYIQIKVLEEVPPGERKTGVYSRIFLVQRKRFYMETIRSTLALLEEGDFLTTIDLKDACLHIPIYPAHQRFLRVAVSLGGSIHHFQFTYLTLGISSAPHIFTKVIAAVVANLKESGITIILYLVEWLIKANSLKILEDHLKLTLRNIQYLGWIRSKQFLGFLLDTYSMTISIPMKRLDGILTAVENLRQPKPV